MGISHLLFFYILIIIIVVILVKIVLLTIYENDFNKVLEELINNPDGSDASEEQDKEKHSKSFQENAPCGEDNLGVLHKNGSYHNCVNISSCDTNFAVFEAQPSDKTKINYKRLSRFRTDLYENIGTAHAKKVQQKHLDKMGLPDVFDEKQSKFFAKSHYASVKDFSTKEEKDATMRVENTTPVQQCINNGNYRAVEQKSRENITNPTTVIAGAFKRLELSNKNGERVFLSLKSDRPVKKEPLKPRYDNIPVKEFLYRLNQDTKTGGCYVVITSNNPNSGIEDLLENKMCDDPHVLKHGKFGDPKRGLTYICSSCGDFVENMKSKYNNDLTPFIDMENIVDMEPQELINYYM